MQLLLKQVTIFDPTSPHHGQTKDILIQDGKIEAIRNGISASTKTLQISGAHVSPGWFDVGALTGDPGYEHIETLDSVSNAASRGGFTSIAVLPNTYPAIHSKSEIEYIKTRSSQLITSIYALGAVTKDCGGVDLAEMMDMYQTGALAFTDGLHSIQNPGVLLRALEYVKIFDGIVINHPFTKGIGPEGLIHEGKVSVSLGLRGIPELSEEMMVKRDLDILKYTKSRLHVHNISSHKSVQHIAQAKDEGLPVTCSVPVINLLENVGKMEDFDVNYKVQPPLREEEDRKALIDGVLDGTIDIIVSNHHPVEIEKKKLEFVYAEFGALGLETAFSSALKAKKGKKWLTQIVHCLSIKSRQIFDIPIPSIKKDNQAEITIFHPGHEWVYFQSNILSRSQNSPDLGQTMPGRVLGVINKRHSKLFVEDEEVQN